jgi:hypothetical protein
MRRVVPRVLAGTVSMLWALSLRAEPTSSSAGAPDADDERAFEADTARYERLAEFTRKLVREREQRAFEEAAERYSRLSALTRKLSEKAAADTEREFDAEVELYLRKRELTRELSRRNAESMTPSNPAPSATSSAAPAW